MSSHRVSVIVPRASAAGTRGAVPSIDLSVCTGCGQCLVVCRPVAVDVVFGDDGTWMPSIDEGKCTRCFDCEAACPERAIEVPFEIVTAGTTAS